MSTFKIYSSFKNYSPDKEDSYLDQIIKTSQTFNEAIKNGTTNVAGDDDQ